MSDDDIDFSDIPELTEEQLAEFRRPGPGWPLAHPVPIPLETAIVRWFQAHAGGEPHEAEINRVLREHIARAERKRT